MERTVGSSSRGRIDPTTPKYDVYLSFRGPDVRHGFADCLYEFMTYSGIRVFMDDEELRIGSEGIVAAIERAIHDSKIWVVIFSRSYASSPWCLRELTTMLDHRRVSDARKMIVPIFYDVDPRDVRLRSDLYRKALEAHKDRFGTEIVRKWEEALLEASCISGWVSREFAGEGRLARLIVRDTLGKLRTSYKSVPEPLTGIENQVDEVMQLLDCDSPEVRFVVVHGMGGIGKTTLAKVVFNRISHQFDGSCFISNVRESSKITGGIVKLQKRLLEDILLIDLPVHDSDDGIAWIQQRLRAKKVLIILDDVDDISQIGQLAGSCDWFGPGTRIIVTTRDRNIASALLGFQAVSDFEMKEMSDEHALRLFSRHAFGGDEPPPDYVDLSKELVKITGKIPLALEVVGAHLYGRTMPIWKETLKKLKHAGPPKPISLSGDTGIVKISTSDDEAETSHEETLHEGAEERGRISPMETDEVEGELEEYKKDDEEKVGKEESAEEPFEDLKLSFEGMQLAALDHIVGIDRQVKRLIKFMNMGREGVQMIGIRDTKEIGNTGGSPGIGKTTLAKAVYSKVSSQFDACCFLEEIREAMARPDGIRPLQFKLIHDILGVEYDADTSYEEAFEVLMEVLRHMKVLIVLDDVENVSHIKKFIGDQLGRCLGLGSTIIVTIRGSHTIAEHLGEDSTIYEYVREMKTDVAVELFNWHAFGKDYPVSDLSAIVKTIVRNLRRCPLLIEAVGSLLHGKKEEEFGPMSKLIGEASQDFWGILAKIYEALDEMQKQMFLDMACFVANEDVRTAIYMWHDCLSRHPGRILMPFAKVGKDDRLWLHSSLRYFGRRIVHAEDNESSGISSRVFIHQSAVDILKNGRGTEEVEALCLDFGGQPSMQLTKANFRSMPKLRFLKLDSAVITGDFVGVFPKLRWLQWRRCPMDFEATNVDMEDLVILDLSGSAVSEDWKGWDSINMVNAKVLNLSNCADLLLTPKFERSPDLERLILEGCPRLVYIDPSIGALKHLAFLNLKHCRELIRLPQELGELVALRELLIDGTGVEEIPEIGKLKQLEILSCSKCVLLRRLPDSIGELERLQKLSVKDCRKVQDLPECIGSLGSSLAELDISGTGVAKLPISISDLRCLKVLRMDSCFISQLPSTIGRLFNLEELHASRCRNLKEIPSEIGDLVELRILELRYAGISSLPMEVRNLDKLETLDILHCDKIKKPPPLPLGLKVRHMDPQLMRQVQETDFWLLLKKIVL